jgi:hypothetical protein
MPVAPELRAVWDAMRPAIKPFWEVQYRLKPLPGKCNRKLSERSER